MRVAALSLCLVGCSLWTDFDDECATSQHCAPLGAGYTCVEGRCRAPLGAGGAGGDGDAAPEADGGRDLGLDAGPVTPDAGDAEIDAAGDGPLPDVTPDAPPPPPVTSPECPRLVGASEVEVQTGQAALLALVRRGELGTSAGTIEAAVELALEEINASETMTRPVALLVCADGDLAAVAAHLAGNGALMVVGIHDGESLQAAFAASLRGAGVPVLTPAALAPGLRRAEDAGLVWRTRAPITLAAEAAAQYVASRPGTVLLVNKIGGASSGGASLFLERLCALTDDEACGPGALAVARYSDAIEPSEALAAHAELGPDVIVTVAPSDELAGVYSALGPFMPAQVVAIEGARSRVALEAFDGARGVVCNTLGLTGGLPGPRFESWAARLAERTGEPIGPLAARYYDTFYLAALALATTDRLGLPPTGEHLGAALGRMSSGPDAPLGPEHFAATVDIMGGGLAASVDVSGVSGGLDLDPETGDVIEVVEAWRYHLTDGQIESVGSVFSAATGYRRPPDKSPDARCAELVDDP